MRCVSSIANKAVNYFVCFCHIKISGPGNVVLDREAQEVSRTQLKFHAR